MTNPNHDPAQERPPDSTTEPVLTSNGIVAVILAVCALAGVVLTDVQINAITVLASVLVPLVLPLIAGYVARSRVTPVRPERRGDDLEFGPRERVEREERPPGRAGDHDPDAR